jgi:hypothetical protein
MVRDSRGGDAAHGDDLATVHAVGCRDSLLTRVLSARALDIFSTSERSIVTLECSEVIGLAATKQAGQLGNLQPSTSIVT